MIYILSLKVLLPQLKQVFDIQVYTNGAVCKLQSEQDMDLYWERHHPRRLKPFDSC